MRPATIDVADNTLRCFAGFLVRTHPESRRVRRRAPHPRRRVQAVLRRPPHRQGCPAGTQHDPPTARDAALLLRSDHRVGLARRTGADADLRRRRSRRRRPAATVPRRRPSRPLRRRRRGRDPVRSARDRAALTDRDACRRALHARRRRRRRAQRHPVVADPRRQAPQRPLRPAPPQRSAAPHRLDRRAPTARRTAPAPRRRPHQPSPDRPDRAQDRPSAPGSATSTRTSCATPSRPRRSTAGCASKRSPRCSATAACG